MAQKTDRQTLQLIDYISLGADSVNKLKTIKGTNQKILKNQANGRPLFFPSGGNITIKTENEKSKTTLGAN